MHMRPRSAFHAFTMVLGNVLVVEGHSVLYEYYEYIAPRRGVTTCLQVSKE